MSSTQTVRRRVIVRGFGGEPTALWVQSEREGRVVVENDAGSHSLSMPAESVYEFDLNILQTLSAIVASGDGDSIDLAWKEAKKFVVENVLQ